MFRRAGADDPRPEELARKPILAASATPWAPNSQWLTNDGLPPPTPSDDQLDDDLIFEGQHRVKEHNLSTRLALHAALMAFAFVLYHGAARPLLLGFLGVSSLVGLGISVLVNGNGRAISPVPVLFDGLVNLVLIILAPQLFPYVAIIGAFQFGTAVVAAGVIEASFGALLLCLAAPIVTVLGREPAIDLLMVGFFAAGVPALAYISGRTRTIERSTRKKYLELLGELDAVVWEADPQTLELTFASPQTRPTFGVAPMLFIRRWSEYIHPDDRDRVEIQRRGAISDGEESFTLEHRMVHRLGETVHVRNNYSIQYDSSRRATRVRGAIVDITRQQEAENTIRKQAQYDSLTGLPNRSLFNDQLLRRLDDARRSDEGLAVLLLDLNGFKEVNDTLGHAVGDQLLQAIAGRLAAYLPERSLVARLGGDEFAVMVHPSNPRAAAGIAETIASCLQPPVTVDSMTIQAGAATGIALYPQDGDSPASLLRRADAAMYEAKQSGRTHMFATPDDDEANVRRLQLLGELRASIATGDFRLYHQPKIDLRTGAIVGTEGLIRWQHRQFGILSPSEFVELTELSGLIQPLTRWVVEQGIRDCAEWRKSGYELMVALNLSVRNFFDQGLPSFIAQLLSDYKVPGDQIVLEITEREVMADRALARTALSAFRSLGVKISIDDFGTGFSSLSQLQLLPIDEIKVDQSFVAGMLSNPQDGVIVRSIVDLGRNLDLEVVAEGAEDYDQLAALRDLGADRAQGYVISRPIPGDEFKRWLQTLEHRNVDGKLQLIFPGAPLGDAAPGKFGSASGRILLAAGSRSTDSASRVAVAVPTVASPVSSVNALSVDAASLGGSTVRRAEDPPVRGGPTPSPSVLLPLAATSTVVPVRAAQFASPSAGGSGSTDLNSKALVSTYGDIAVAAQTASAPSDAPRVTIASPSPVEVPAIWAPPRLASVPPVDVVTVSAAAVAPVGVAVTSAAAAAPEQSLSTSAPSPSLPGWLTALVPTLAQSAQSESPPPVTPPVVISPVVTPPVAMPAMVPPSVISAPVAVASAPVTELPSWLKVPTSPVAASSPPSPVAIADVVATPEGLPESWRQLL